MYSVTPSTKENVDAKPVFSIDITEREYDDIAFDICTTFTDEIRDQFIERMGEDSFEDIVNELSEELAFIFSSFPSFFEEAEIRKYIDQSLFKITVLISDTTEDQFTSAIDLSVNDDLQENMLEKIGDPWHRFMSFIFSQINHVCVGCLSTMFEEIMFQDAMRNVDDTLLN